MLTLCCLAAASLLIFQAVLVFGFVRATRTPLNDLSQGSVHRVLVVLCARGNDPSFAECLESLEQQSGERLQILLVTDHSEDPAVAEYQRHVARHPETQIRQLVAPLEFETCSLKCQSLAYAVAEHGAPADVLLAIDADVVPSPTWVRQLQAALDAPRSDRSVADAAFGNRWFQPATGAWGSWLRYVWNAAAIVQMHHYRIPWGGSLALRREAVEKTQLVKIWRRALFEDVLITQVFSADRRIVVSAAPVFLVNRESCSLRTAWRWMVRQLLDVRLYHRSWPLVAGHAFAVAGLPAAFGVGVGYGWLTGQFEYAAQAACAWLVFQLLNLGLLYWISSAAEAAISRQTSGSVDATHVRFPGERLWWWGRMLCLLPLVQLWHCAAVIQAALVRRTEWRGIHYEVRGPWAIRRGPYTPCSAATPAATDGD